MGYDERGGFRADADAACWRTVQGHYARLFESEPDLTDGARQSGLHRRGGRPGNPRRPCRPWASATPPHVSAAIRGWHHGRIRAMRSQRARELLTKLMPAILKALAGAADPDAAFTQFDRFLSSLPSGVQLFSLFLARPQFLDLLAQDRGLGAAPGHLSGAQSRHPGCAAGCGFPQPPAVARRAGCSASRAQLHAAAMKSMLDAARAASPAKRSSASACRSWKARPRPKQAGPALADIAECVIAGLLPRVEDELAASAGRMPGAGFCRGGDGQAGRAGNDRQFRSRPGVRL